MGENICKCSNLQGINLQNIQTFKQSSKYTKYAAQYQTEQNYPIKKNEQIQIDISPRIHKDDKIARQDAHSITNY